MEKLVLEVRNLKKNSIFCLCGYHIGCHIECFSPKGFIRNPLPFQTHGDLLHPLMWPHIRETSFFIIFQIIILVESVMVKIISAITSLPPLCHIDTTWHHMGLTLTLLIATLLVITISFITLQDIPNGDIGLFFYL